MIRIFDYEISFKHETCGWYCEDFENQWSWTFSIKWLSPFEKKHRAELKEYRSREKEDSLKDPQG